MQRIFAIVLLTAGMRGSLLKFGKQKKKGERKKERESRHPQQVADDGIEY